MIRLMWRYSLAWLGIAGTALALSACGGGGGSGNSGSSNASGVYADRVVAYVLDNSTGATAAEWPYFFNDQLALGAPGGTLDVVSLGYTVTGGFNATLGDDPTTSAALGGYIVLGLGDSGGHRCIVDGSGDDFVVYENAFRTTDASGNAGTNNEVAIVEVSANGTAWYGITPKENTSLPLIDTARYSGFAGVIPEDEGGDRFDLADFITANGLSADFQACYLRITDGGTVWADYGNTQSDLYASGADIDSVEALHSVAAPDQSP